MSCSVDKILDDTMQKKIDEGVNYLASDIRKKLDENDETCIDSKLDKFVAISSIIMQYIVFAFILIAITHKEYAGTIVKVIVFTTFITTALLAIQYRNVLISALRLLNALDLSTKIVLVLTVLATIGTGYIKDGGAGLYTTLGIAGVLFIRLSLQVKDFLTGEKSPIPAFTKFMRETLTTNRINTLYNAFK